MATKRADQRKLQTSVTMSQSMFNAIRDVAHELGTSNSEVVVIAIGQFLKAHYPALAEQAQL